MIDGQGRNINYLRISVTDRCNLRCKYCMPEKGVEKIAREDILSYEEIDKIVGVMARLGVDKIRLTGGEPLVRPDIVTLVKKIRSHPQIREITMTTNGIYLEEMAEDLKKAGLNRVNISLDTLNPQGYREMTRGGDLKKALKGIQAARQAGLTPIKINVVLINGFNDGEIEDFVAMTRDEAVDVRFIELMPIGEVANWSKSHFISNEEVLRRVPGLVPVKGDDPSSPATYYRLPRGKGKVGLISPISCKFCSLCNRIRLTSEGFLKPCLHSDEEIPLRPLVDSPDLLEATLRRTVFNKPAEHHLEEGKIISRNMFKIGG
ncbi:MAG: cyclic pyranopterin phosphate synthase MoaA [delta proteobacterium ML8_F1]|nr:MAG: cyclic pyranopterin phosphate synthase MoaA [delta proteobacterium ML8_F1]